MQIKNKKAYYNYEVLETFTAGIMLLGPEVKSIKGGKCSIGEAHCYFKDGELFVKNLTITDSGETIDRPKKLLLKKKELNELSEKVAQKGLTIVPLKMFSKKALLKMEIGLCRGKKLHDKRNTIKERDLKRELDRNL